MPNSGCVTSLHVILKSVEVPLYNLDTVPGNPRYGLPVESLTYNRHIFIVQLVDSQEKCFDTHSLTLMKVLSVYHIMSMLHNFLIIYAR